MQILRKKIDDLIECFVEIRGDKSVFIEGCEKICEYSPENVSVRTCCGKHVYINGAMLTLSYFSEDRISVRGKIAAVRFE